MTILGSYISVWILLCFKSSCSDRSLSHVILASDRAGGTQRLPRLVGKSVAKDIIFTGRKVSGKDAMSLGVFNCTNWYMLCVFVTLAFMWNLKIIVAVKLPCIISSERVPCCRSCQLLCSCWSSSVEGTWNCSGNKSEGTICLQNSLVGKSMWCVIWLQYCQKSLGSQNLSTFTWIFGIMILKLCHCVVNHACSKTLFRQRYDYDYIRCTEVFRRPSACRVAITWCMYIYFLVGVTSRCPNYTWCDEVDLA